MFSGTEGFVLAILIIVIFLPLVVIGLVVVVNNRLPGRRRADPAGAVPEPTTPPPDGPGWFADPAGRHEQRYWDGARWTDAVVSDGRPGTDPM